MFSTDNLFFLIYFVVPGAIYLLYKRFIQYTPQAEKDETIRIAGALFFSFIVFGANALVFSSLFKAFSAQNNIFSDSVLLLEIIAINIGASFIICSLWTLLSKFRLRFRNFVYRIFGRTETGKYNSVWLELFYGGEIEFKKYGCVVKIEKDNLQSVGLAGMFSSPSSDRIDFLISYPQEIQELFKADEEKPEAERLFSKILHEYMDLTNGYKITFYDMQNYSAYCEEYEKSAAQSNDAK
jgi:hypothetical protein